MNRWWMRKGIENASAMVVTQLASIHFTNYFVNTFISYCIVIISFYNKILSRAFGTMLVRNRNNTINRPFKHGSLPYVLYLWNSIPSSVTSLSIWWRPWRLHCDCDEIVLVLAQSIVLRICDLKSRQNTNGIRIAWMTMTTASRDHLEVIIAAERGAYKEYMESYNWNGSLLIRKPIFFNKIRYYLSINTFRLVYELSAHPAYHAIFSELTSLRTPNSTLEADQAPSTISAIF